jgi:heat shock protein beta
MASSKRNLEINPSHPIIKELLSRVKNTADKDTEDMAILLYEAALLMSGLVLSFFFVCLKYFVGYTLSDPREFSNKFFKIFNPALGLTTDATVEEIEVDLNTENNFEAEPITPISESYHSKYIL